MKTKPMKIMSIFLTLVMLVMIIGVLSITASAADITIDYTTESQTWGSGSSTMVWDKSTKTLTLNNYTLEGMLTVSGNVEKIVLVGNNTIKGGQHGIYYTAGNTSTLTITSQDTNNPGTLTVICDTSGSYDFSVGIYGYYASLLIENATVNTTGGTSTSLGAGIYMESNVTIENATVNATCADGERNNYGIYSGGTLSITNSTVNAVGGYARYSKGINAKTADINKNSVIYAKGSDLADSSYGLDVLSGDLTIAGNVKLTAIGNYGIRVMTETFKSVYADSVITAIGKSFGIWTKSASISSVSTCLATKGVSASSQALYIDQYKDQEVYKTSYYSVRSDEGTEQSALYVTGVPSVVYIGDSFKLTVTGGSGDGIYFWQSSDVAIATVDQNGNVSVKGAGEFTITARKAADGTYKEASKLVSFNAICTHSDSEHTTGTDNENSTHNFLCTVCESIGTEDHTGGNYIADGNVITDKCTVCDGTTGVATLTASGDTYDGAAYKATVNSTGTFENKIWTITYTANGDSSLSNGQAVNVGSYTASISIGGVTASQSFTIKKADPKASDFALSKSVEIYNGEAQSITVSANSGIVGMGVITFKYYDENGDLVTDPTYVGVYTVRVDVTDGNNYNAITDLEVGNFEITPKTLAVTDITVSEGVTYNGEPQIPTVTVEGLILNTDYTVSWDKEGFVNADTYTVTVKGIGNYGGTVTKTYQIAPKPLVDSDITIDITEAIYNGEAQAPTVTVAGLVRDTDYTVTWDQNGFVNAATYTATIEGKGNYSGTFTRTLVINKAELVVELTSPISSVLPGNQIALNLTVNSTEGTPVWSFTNATHVSGSIIKVDDDLVIGQDTVTITVTYDETANYKGGSKTITLDVGMPDVTGEIADLEEKINALNELIKDKADTSVVEQKMNEISAKIEALEQVKDAYVDADAALKVELEDAIADAKNEAMTAANTALEKAKDELKGLIESGDAKNATELADAVQNLNDAIALAQQTAEKFATDADAALKVELEARITSAELLIDSVRSRVSKAEKAIKNLNEAIDKLESVDKANAEALAEAIESLNKAIDEAKKIAADSDKDISKELTDKINAADNALREALNELQQNLNDTKKELDGKIEKLNTAVIVVAVIAVLGVCGNVAILVWIIKRKRVV